MWGNAVSLAVRQQDIANRFLSLRQQPSSNRQLNHNNNERFGSQPSKGSVLPQPSSFFEPPPQPKMDAHTFMAAVFQKIHATILRYWKNQAPEEAKKPSNAIKTWYA